MAESGARALALARRTDVSSLALVSNAQPAFRDGLPPHSEWVSQFPLRSRSLWMHVLAPLELARLRPDLTHWTNYNAPAVGGGPFVVSFHDMAMWRYPEFFGWKKRFLSRALLPHTARRAR